jgi:hypothetical protein
MSPTPARADINAKPDVHALVREVMMLDADSDMTFDFCTVRSLAAYIDTLERSRRKVLAGIMYGAMGAAGCLLIFSSVLFLILRG